MRSVARSKLLLGLLGGRVLAQGDAPVDLGWHAPRQSQINNLTQVLDGSGVYGFIYDSSVTPDEKYGTYNWCNMPHARAREYEKVGNEYELQYVEVIHRHHKRTPYQSNTFPVESYRWDCDDEGLYFYGQPFTGPQKAASAYWQGYISPTNPFAPSGFVGTCQFPQITAGGLDDSWQHGADLYALYHDALGFLPGRDADWRSKVVFRVTNNVITSQVAGMLVNGMFGAARDVPLVIEAAGVDSLEPQYSCPAASNAFNAIKSASNPAWAQHLSATASLFATLDDISGVSPSDSGFHASFDHYYDNLSARQCHGKPLPCKLVNGANSTTCVTQALADDVYRLGNWEYSQIYRDSPAALGAAAASFGVWIAELATHLRAVVTGRRDTLYYHNIAHDGSVSRLLAVLQIDTMVWPGMGSEVVFELFKKTGAVPGGSTTLAPTTRAPLTPTSCNHDNCLRQILGQGTAAESFCASHATASAVPTWLGNCKGDAARVSSACACIATATGTASSAAVTPTNVPGGDASASKFYIRVLWGGQVMQSSNPSLGRLDMLPVEAFLAYLDGLAGKDASLVKGKCNT